MTAFILKGLIPALISLSVFLIYFSIFRIFTSIYGIILVDSVSIAALVLSSDVFVDQARTLSSKMHISNASMGKFILATGAVLDEIAIVADSTARGVGGISFGTLEGSNILTLGVLICLVPLLITGKFRSQTMGASIILVSSIIVVPLIFLPVSYTLAFSPFLIIVFLIYLFKGNTKPEMEREATASFSIPLMALAIILLITSSNALVINTDSLSAISGIGDFTAGFLVTGIAGSIPEIIMFLTSIRKIDGDAAIGVLIGSTIYKGTILLALSMLFTRIYFKTGMEAVIYMIPLSIIILILTTVKLRRFYSIILIAAVTIIGYLVY